MPVSVQNNYIPSASTGDEVGYVEGFNGAMTRSSLDAVGQAVGSIVVRVAVSFMYGFPVRLLRFESKKANFD